MGAPLSRRVPVRECRQQLRAEDGLSRPPSSVLLPAPAARAPLVVRPSPLLLLCEPAAGGATRLPAVEEAGHEGLHANAFFCHHTIAHDSPCFCCCVAELMMTDEPTAPAAKKKDNSEKRQQHWQQRLPCPFPPPGQQAAAAAPRYPPVPGSATTRSRFWRLASTFSSQVLRGV